MRDKRNNPLRLEGKSVILEEIQPKFFPYVIKWRNDKELNRYLNQPVDLTMESETQWYEQKYLTDETQGFMIMIDKKANEPFGTRGWTDMDIAKKRCIMGRLLIGTSILDETLAFHESHFLLSDYIYDFVDIVYSHVGIENRKALRLNKFLGYQPNCGMIQFPHELFVNGDSNRKQFELYRTKDMYQTIREKIFKDSLFC